MPYLLAPALWVVTALSQLCPTKLTLRCSVTEPDIDACRSIVNSAIAVGVSRFAKVNLTVAV